MTLVGEEVVVDDADDEVLVGDILLKFDVIAFCLDDDGRKTIDSTDVTNNKNDNYGP